MKKTALIFFALIVAILAILLSGKRKDHPNPVDNTGDPDKKMAGPRGEQLFIGSGGGRYFVREGIKIFIAGIQGRKYAS